jgi:hypothetical protein
MPTIKFEVLPDGKGCKVIRDGIITRVIKDPYPDIDVIENSQQIKITPNVGDPLVVDKATHDIILPGEAVPTTKTVGEIVEDLAVNGFFKVGDAGGGSTGPLTTQTWETPLGGTLVVTPTDNPDEPFEYNYTAP